MFLIPQGGMDLIYLDPPFNSSATYPSADGCSGKER
jgi:16S rRNA G966 N2-methylase RsmD